MAKTANGAKVDKSNLVVRDFLAKYHLNLIDIPEEFKDLEVGDAFKPKPKNKSKSKRVYSRSDKSQRGYDSWRVHDRNVINVTGKDKAECKLMIPPALLKRAFGTPDKT